MVSQMEYTEQQVLEVLITRDHTGQIFKVGGKLLQLNEVVRFYVVPTPNELIERLLLCLFVRYHLWVSLGVKDLSQLLQCVFVASHFAHSSVSVNY